ncbi:MAG: hypothetical protein ABI810_01855 [Sphingomonas bacterium]
MTTQLPKVAQHDQRSQSHRLATDDGEAKCSDEVLAGSVPAQVVQMVDVLAQAKDAAIGVQSLTLNGCNARGIFL